MFADPLIKKAIQSHPLVQRLGTIHSVVLHTAEQKCNLEIGLVGEPAPIRFSAKYKIEKTDSGADFCVFEPTCEKMWIEEILKIFFESKGGILRFPTKGIVAKILPVIL